MNSSTTSSTPVRKGQTAISRHPKPPDNPSHAVGVDAPSLLMLHRGVVAPKPSQPRGCTGTRQPLAMRGFLVILGGDAHAAVQGRFTKCLQSHAGRMDGVDRPSGTCVELLCWRERAVSGCMSSDTGSCSGEGGEEGIVHPAVAQGV